MIATVVTDSPQSWFLPYSRELVTELREFCDARFAEDHNEVREGDVAFYLACHSIVPPNILTRNQCNVVVHESDLPQGRGWSPLAWQILEGKNTIPVTLFEAVEQVDAGPVYMKEYLQFRGNELLSEMREQLGAKTVSMCVRFAKAYPDISDLGEEQVGAPSFYPRRTPNDSELPVGRTIEDQFALLRVVDNERYPAFFHYRGRKYVLRIEVAE